MDNNQIGFVMLSFVQTHFPGGLREFKNKGGLMSVVPFKDDNILLYLPEMPAEFREAIEVLNNESALTVHIVDDLNFKGLHPAKVQRILLELAKEVTEKYDLPSMLFSINNPLVFQIRIPGAVLSKEVVQEIAEMFSEKLPSIARGLIIVGDDIFPFSSNKVYEVTEESKEDLTSYKPVEPERKPITDETLTDLKILLGTSKDVMDFINQL